MWWTQPTAGPALLMQTRRCADGGMHQAQRGVLALDAAACSPSMQPLTRPCSGFLSPPILICSLPISVLQPAELPPLRLPAAKRLVAIGDLHGDLDKVR